MRDILLRTNQLLDRERFRVRLIARRGLNAVASGPVSVSVSNAQGPFDHLIVPPYAPAADPFAARPAELRLIGRLHAKGAVVHSACLGSLLVAQTGLLDGRSATTHWAWVESARARYQNVAWDVARMLCPGDDVVTAGGFLAAVDLTLALVERECGRAVSREVGRLLLVDSVRQHQSIYATTLAPTSVDEPRMKQLHRWIDAHLAQPITVGDMAQACHLSARSFHRLFAKSHGFTPKKLVQLKRIERVRSILRDARVSVEAAIAQVGVSDVPSFRKVFQRELGLSPAEYRRRLRAHAHRPTSSSRRST